MLKQIWIIILSCLIMLCFTACDMFDDSTPDPAYKDRVDYVNLEDGTHYIEYLGEKFLLFSEDTIFVEQLEDDIFLSWSGTWWGYQNSYFSSVKEKPLFIYETRIDYLYFHEDYDYLTDTFVIDGTTEEIVWKDIFNSEQSDISFENPVEVELYSKQCPRIKAKLQLKCINNQWYVSYVDTKKVWTISDEFMKILLENSIICE